VQNRSAILTALHVTQARALVVGHLGGGVVDMSDADSGATRNILSPAGRAALHALCDEALAKFGKTATVLVMVAGLHLDWDRNVYLALKHCNSALALQPAADEALRLRVIRAAALEYEARTVAGASAANTQREFRRHTAAAEAAALAVARGKEKLFAELRAASDSSVNLLQALAASRAIMAAYDAAAAHYQAALVLLPSSISAMRAYAALLNDCFYDSSAAASVLSAADVQEESQSKQNARLYRRVNWIMATSFDVALEGNAVIEVSVEARNLGSVIQANSEACRLFGHSKQVCAGSTLVPHMQRLPCVLFPCRSSCDPTLAASCPSRSQVFTTTCCAATARPAWGPSSTSSASCSASSAPDTSSRWHFSCAAERRARASSA
jgi:hypothetical protein